LILNSDEYGIIFEGEVKGKIKKDSLIGNNAAILVKGKSEI